MLKANMVGERWKTGRYSQPDFAFNRLAFDDDVEPRSFCIYDRLGIEICGFGSRLSGTQRFFDQSQLPKEQSSLCASYNYKPHRKEPGRIMGKPIPQSAFLWLGLVRAVRDGACLGWLVTQWLPATN
jgi:hypothetical protein